MALATQKEKMQSRQKRQKLKTQRLEILSQINAFEKQMYKTKSAEERKAIKNSVRTLGQKLQQLVLNPVVDPNEIILSKETYIAFKLRGFTDKKVAEAVGQTKGYVDRWKHEQGITKDSWQSLVSESV